MQWFEDEGFWYELKNFLFPAAIMNTAAEEAEAVLRLAGLREGNVLDLCCGIGRHSRAFATNNMSVTGVDLNASFLRDAASTAEHMGLNIEWLQSDMRTFRRNDSFDLCTNLYNSFGYFVSPTDDRAVLENIYASLKPGGIVVIDTPGKEVVAKSDKWLRVERVGAELLYRQIFVDDGWNSLTERWLHWTPAKGKEYVLQHSIYSGQELSELLSQCGFTAIRLLGDFDARPYDGDANRLLAVAQKRP